MWAEACALLDQAERKQRHFFELVSLPAALPAWEPPADVFTDGTHFDVVVALPGRTATADELRTHCKTLIAGYKAPRTVDFVDALPMSGAGKILKRELRKRYWGDPGNQVS